MLTISAADDGTNHRAEIKMIDQPNWPIEDYLDLLDSIQQLPPDEQQQAIDDFFESASERGRGCGPCWVPKPIRRYPPQVKTRSIFATIRDARGRG